jgi:hypothetical protein
MYGYIVIGEKVVVKSFLAFGRQQGIISQGVGQFHLVAPPAVKS